MLPIVRRATDADVEAAARTLSTAFADCPWAWYTVAADRHVERLRQSQLLYLAGVALPYGRVWVTENCEAVAVWIPPEGAPCAERALADLDGAFATLAGDRAEVWAEAEEQLARFRPRQPVWLLATVGVDPLHQGLGLGKGVMCPGLEAAAARGCPVYLETSRHRNMALYSSLGFEVAAEVQLPAEGPRVWCMLRPPGGARRQRRSALQRIFT